MNEPGGHYAKWNKPDTERWIWISHDLVYMWNLKKNVQLVVTESRMGIGKGGDIDQRYKLPLWDE